MSNAAEVQDPASGFKSGSRLERVLAGGHFAVTGEIGPPKGWDPEVIRKKSELLLGYVDGANITDNQTAIVRMSSIAAGIIAKQQGLEPIIQMTCRDRNRLALQADLLLAYSRGITNVLYLTGDSVNAGDHKEAKPVFDLDSVQLIRMIKTMESGTDMAKNELKGVPKFCIGASVHPEADFIEPQLIKFDKKVAAGAQFFQTQGIFDLACFRQFMQYVSQSNVKILAGIIVMASAGMARYMNRNVPGIIVPQAIIDELATAEKGKELQKGIEIATRFIRTIKRGKLCHGIHIMTVGNEDIVPDILEMTELVGMRR